MARKPRSRSEESLESVEPTPDERLGRLEAELEEMTLSASVQARDVQTLRARLDRLKQELDEIGEGASAEDLQNVEGLLKQLGGRLDQLAADGEAQARESGARLKALEEGARGIGVRVEELSQGEKAARALKEGLSSLRKEVDGKLEDHRRESRQDRATLETRLFTELGEKFDELPARFEATRVGLRTELDSIHEVLRAEIDGLKGESATRASTSDLLKLRKEVESIKTTLGEVNGLGQRAQEALTQVTALEKQLAQTEARFQEVSRRVDEAARQAEGQIEKLTMALRLVEQLDDRVRRVGSRLEFGGVEELDLLEVEAGAELGFELDDLLQVMVKHQASDLHLKVGTPPTVRLDGELIPVGNQVLSSEDCKALVLSALAPAQRAAFAQRRELDFAHSISGARFRVNAFLERGQVSAAFRMLRSELPTLDELGLPAALKQLAELNHGLVLVTGPAGSGKSTTLAALIDHINTHRKAHIVTIEDPIEFYHKDKMSIVTQREIGADAVSFEQALRQALRQDPNVIMVGEMRDPETMLTAVLAAETGHLVLSTLHTPNTVQAVDRILDTFSGEAQRQFRMLLANNLRGVVSQRLLVRADEKGRVPAVEVMRVTPTLRSLILEGRTQDIYPHIQQGASEGMQTFTESLLRLLEAGLIHQEEAMFHSDQPTELRLGATGHSTASASNMADDALMNWL